MKSRVAWVSAAMLFAWWCAAPLAPVFAQAAATATAPKITAKIDGEYGYWLPSNIAKQSYAHQGDYLNNLLHWFMAILFVAWGIFFVYCLIRFRSRPGHRANSQLPHAKISKYAEVGVAIFEGVLLIGLAIPAWAAVKNDIPTADRNPLRVRVIGEQFQWTFHYSGADGVFGKTAAAKVDTATNPAGLDKADPHAADDIVVGEFHIPVDRPIICDISSKDVIHSFFVPVLRVKQDAVPGMRIPIWFEAGRTGNYEVACAQLCGNNHYSMRALMVIQTAAEFEEWLKVKSAPPEEFDEDEL